MNHGTEVLIAAVVVGLVVAPASVTLGGDLDPPAGGVGPTMKTLEEVEPRIPLNHTNTPGDFDSLYRITESGNYYLTENTEVRSSESGIEIAASHVTIDLMGFRLLGLNGSVSGISVPSSQSHLTIRNGLIFSFDSHGIDALNAVSVIIENVTVSTSMGTGIWTGSHALVIGCRAGGNGEHGIRTNPGSVLRDCIATFNTQVGIYCVGGVMTNCTASNNGTDGFLGQGALSRCIAWDNTSNGFEMNGASTFDGCIARSNSENGFYIANRSFAFVNCVADDNTEHGFYFSGAGPTAFIGCSAGNNDLSGINAPPGSTIESCAASENGVHGITGGYAMTITGCTATENTGDGIRVTSRSYVTGNTCRENGLGAGDGAGIHATNSDNRIDGNHVTFNDRGIDVDFTINVIVRNSASGNTTNYDIFAGNIVGPFVDGTNITTEDSPHANYDY